MKFPYDAKEIKIEIKSASILYYLSIKECLSGFESWQVEEINSGVVVKTSSFQQIVFLEGKVWLLGAKEKIKTTFQDGKEWMTELDEDLQNILLDVEILHGFVLTTKNSQYEIVPDGKVWHIRNLNSRCCQSIVGQTYVGECFILGKFFWLFAVKEEGWAQEICSSEIKNISEATENKTE